MMYFSIPADYIFETIDKLANLNSLFQNKVKVIETYGQATENVILNSGRVTETLPKATMQTLEKYVRYSLDRDIGFNYTINPACFGNYEFSEAGIHSLLAFLKSLKNIGIDSLTVTSPSLFELIQHSGISFKLKASAICEIMSPDKAMFYKKIGADRIVIDPDITRNFKRLKSICDSVGDSVEIIVNNVCYKNCPYKMFHYNHEAHCNNDNNKQTIKNYYINRCSMQKAGNYINPIRLNWIRPEDINCYHDIGINYFKIQGRQNIVSGDVIKVLHSYFCGSFDGNLYDLITLFSPYNAFQPYIDNKSLDGFINKFLKEPCNDMCEQCGYCESYAGKSMDIKKAKELNYQSLQFFNEYDTYTNLIEAETRIVNPNNKLLNDGMNFKF